MIKRLFYSICILAILTTVSAMWGVVSTHSSGDDDLDGIDPFAEAVEPEVPIQFVEGVVDARLEYQFDVLAIDEYFVEVRAFPGAGVPTITGGFVETNVDVRVKLRGVSCPSACMTPETRNRPHVQIDLERKRWASGMEFGNSASNHEPLIATGEPCCGRRQGCRRCSLFSRRRVAQPC